MGKLKVVFFDLIKVIELKMDFIVVSLFKFFLKGSFREFRRGNLFFEVRIGVLGIVRRYRKLL